jgi:amino acid permease
MYKYATQNDIDFIGVFATKDHSQIQRWRDITLVQWPSYMAEDTSLKEIARGKIAVVYINNGIIQWKRTLSSIPSDIFSTPQENIIENLNFNGEDRFKSISFIFVSILTLILILNITILAVKRSFSRKNEKKNVTLQDENKIEITN